MGEKSIDRGKTSWGRNVQWRGETSINQLFPGCYRWYPFHVVKKMTIPADAGHLYDVASVTHESRWMARRLDSVNVVTFSNDLDMLVGHWTSVKRVPFESSGAVSYSPSQVTMAVSLTVYKIFSFKEGMTLKTDIFGCSRSLNMAPFDRTIIRLMTFYWSAIVNIALSCNVFLRYLTLNNIVSMKV